MSVWTTPLGIAGIVFIVIGIIMAIVGIILLVLDKDVEKPWYIWVLLAGGIVMGIIGGIMLAVAYSREEPKLVSSMYCGVPTNKPTCVGNELTTFPPNQCGLQNNNNTACLSVKNTPARVYPQQGMVSNYGTPVKPLYTTMPNQPMYNQGPMQQNLFTPAPMIQDRTVIQQQNPNVVGKIDDSYLELPPIKTTTIAPQRQTAVTLPSGEVGVYHHDSLVYENTVPGGKVRADMVDPYGREYL